MRAKRCYARLLYIYIYYPSKIDPTIEEQKILMRLSEKDNFVVKSRRKGRYDRSIDRSRKKMIYLTSYSPNVKRRFTRYHRDYRYRV